MNVTPTINTKRLFKRTSRVKKIRKSFARYGVVSVNTILVMAMIGFLGYGKLKHDPQVAQTNNAVTATEQVAVLDEISSADIAANIAIAAKLPEADQVRNQADSRNALATIAVSNDTVVAKPQIITNETASSQSPGKPNPSYREGNRYASANRYSTESSRSGTNPRKRTFPASRMLDRRRRKKKSSFPTNTN
jgi:hypothetical protein